MHIFRKHDFSPYSVAYKTNYNLSSSLKSHLFHRKSINKLNSFLEDKFPYSSGQKLSHQCFNRTESTGTLVHQYKYLCYTYIHSLWSLLNRKITRAFTRNPRINTGFKTLVIDTATVTKWRQLSNSFINCSIRTTADSATTLLCKTWSLCHITCILKLTVINR